MSIHGDDRLANNRNENRYSLLAINLPSVEKM